MMDKKLTLAYSTCPNDTFMFYALAHGRIDNAGLEYAITLKDVERLNRDAQNDVFDVSKLSFAAIGHLCGRYRLLKTGAALGNGCGPLVVSRPGSDLSQLSSSAIAVPGLHTTAYLLLGLYLPETPRVVPMTFDEIMPAVSDGRFDFGVIIHEGRFTFQNYGLVELLDLGAWWEQTTHCPIPLGGIAVRSDMPEQTARQVETAIGQSIAYAYAHPLEADAYIRMHAKELSGDVIQRHIDLYVNSYSLGLGDIGINAVETLFEMARKKHLIPACDHPIIG